MRLIDYIEVAHKLSIQPLAVLRLAKTPDFPKKTQVLGPRSGRWVEEEIDEWIENYRKKEKGNGSSRNETVSERPDGCGAG